MGQFESKVTERRIEHQYRRSGVRLSKLTLVKTQLTPALPLFFWKTFSFYSAVGGQWMISSTDINIFIFKMVTAIAE